MKKRISFAIGCVIAFVIPALVFLFALKTNQIYPFGDNTILFVDSQGQYIHFISYFKTILSGQNDLSYTFAKPLGGDMVSLFCYYLVSPFNLLYFFFDTVSLPLAVSIVTILKIGTIGITMYILMNYLHKEKYIANLIFSCSYALCSYVIVYNFNFMFLDGVIWAPLVVLGLKKLFEKQKNLSYIIFLAIAILMNYYIGFMICVFSVCFFLFKLYGANYDKTQKKQYWILFIKGSLLAGALSSFNWLSAVMNMVGAKASLENSSEFSMATLWKISDFTKNLTSGSYQGMDDIIMGAPLIFIGLISLSLTIMYFLNERIDKNEKIAAGVLLGFYVFCMAFTFPNNLLHAGSAPNWFPFRYAFLFNLFMLYLAAKQFNSMEGFRLHHFIIPLFFMALSWTILAVYEVKTNIGQDVLLACISFILIFVIKHFKQKYITLASTILIVIINCISLNNNTKSVIAKNMEEVTQSGSTNYIPYETYKNEYEEISKVIQYVKDSDQTHEFYRMEKTFYSQATYNLANNDSFMYDYAGLTHYSSCDKLSTRNYLAYYMGFHSNYSWTSYGLGSTLTANSLMGVKYIIDRDREYNSILISNRHFGARNYLTSMQDFDSYLGDTIHVFENPYALSIGYAANKTNDVQIEGSINPFVYQNNMLKNISGLSLGDVMVPLNYSTTLSNLKQIDATHYELINTSQPGYINYTVTINPLIQYPMYYYITPGFSQYMSLFDSTNLYYFNMYNYAVNPIVRNNTSATKTYRLKLNENLYWSGVEITPYFYYENIDLLGQYIDNIKINQIALERISSSHLKGKNVYSSNKPYLTFSIPYEGKWKVTINGKSVQTCVNQNLFLCVDTSNLAFENGQELLIDIHYQTNEYIYSIILGLIAIAYIVITTYNLDKKIIKKFKKE